MSKLCEKLSRWQQGMQPTFFSGTGSQALRTVRADPNQTSREMYSLFLYKGAILKEGGTLVKHGGEIT